MRGVRVLNYVWVVMLISGFIVGMFSGRMEEVTKAAFDSTGKAVELAIGLLGIICLWTGLMKIAEKSGLVKGLAKILLPLLKLLFPDIPDKHPALGAVVMNLTANFLGLGNAATPLGIKAMEEMQKLNRFRRKANRSMSMFIILNTSAVQLIPATIIAVRASAKSHSPGDIIGPIWIASICSCLAGIAAVKLFCSKKDGR